MSKATINATVYWAQLEKQNDLSGKYQVDLAHLSDAAGAALEEMGIELKFDDERQNYITCKSTRPIYAEGVDGESLRGIDVGNGSKATAVITPYSWTFKGKKGVSPSIAQLIITALEEYEGGDAEAYGEVNLDEAL